MSPLRYLLALSLLMGGLAVAMAQDSPKIYKWTDANGTVHYGTQPPDEDRAQEMNVPVADAAPVADPADPAPADPDAGADANSDQARCDRHRENLKLLEDRSRPITVRRGDKLFEVDDKERELQLNAARAALALCERED